MATGQTTVMLIYSGAAIGGGKMSSMGWQQMQSQQIKINSPCLGQASGDRYDKIIKKSNGEQFERRHQIPLCHAKNRPRQI